MQVQERTEYIGLPNATVEVGDLAHEIGKRYLAELWKFVEAHRDLGLKKAYVWARMEKNPVDKIKTIFKYDLLLKPLKKLRQSSSLYEYDYLTDTMLLLWSIPHRSQFRNMLAYPERCDPKQIEAVKRYIKQQGLKIDSKPIIIPIN